MKKLLISALVLGAGLTACSGDKKADAPEGGGNETSSTETPKAQLASFEVKGMT